MSTLFASVYNRFLGKITDDMYLELTPEDTIKDLQNLLIDAIPGFEFPRIDLYSYKLSIEEIPENEVCDEDFVLGAVWGTIPDYSENSIPEMGKEICDNTKYRTTWGELPDAEKPQVPTVIVDRSYFSAELTAEEINILACLMKQGWVQRQVSSIENTRMKYSGSDFKFTSQANHLAKLMNLLEESRRDSFHMQRLYKRRKLGSNGYQSNWSSLREESVFD